MQPSPQSILKQFHHSRKKFIGSHLPAFLNNPSLLPSSPGRPLSYFLSLLDLPDLNFQYKWNLRIWGLPWLVSFTGNPLQCSCLENPRDGGACWAAVYGVTQSQTQLKWLSRLAATYLWLPSSAFQCPILKRTCFWVVVLEGLVGLHRIIQLQLLQHY